MYLHLFVRMIKNVRQLENAHIFFWLIKDICWMMQYKTAGMIVAVPTFSMALYLTLATFRYKEHFYPNLAVLCWISANIVWMTGEFFFFNFAPAALFLFVSGVIVISYYFLRFYKQPKTPVV